LVDWNVAALKLASTDLTNTLLLDAAIETGKPLILSTGTATRDEIDAAIAQIRDKDALHRVILLHCISCYPTPLENLNLRTMTTLQARYSCPVGLSDHTTSTSIGYEAVRHKACILEKHLTYDTGASGPDHASSLDPARFARYCELARSTLKDDLGLGETMADPDALKHPLECEGDVRRVARQSVTTVRPIGAGEPITPDCLTLKRPGTGIPARYLEDVAGRRAAVPIEADVPVVWEDLA